MYYLGTRSKRQMVGMNPILAFAVTMAIKRTEQDFGIFDKGGVRAEKDHADMYAQGRTKPGPKVTWTLNSNHCSGNAVDLVAVVNGKPTWEEKYYKEIEIAMKSVIKDYDLPIRWGFDLWGKDLPHWQMANNNNYDVRKLKES